MRHTFVRFALALAAASAVVACGDSSTGPQAKPRVYALQSLDGQPLPIIELVNGTDTTSLLSESFTLRADGSATRAQTRIESGTPTIQASMAKYTYTIDGGQIEVRPVCPPGALALCVGPMMGAITDGDLVLSFATTDPHSPTLRYTRVLPD